MIPDAARQLLEILAPDTAGSALRRSVHALYLALRQHGVSECSALLCCHYAAADLAKSASDGSRLLVSLADQRYLHTSRRSRWVDLTSGCETSARGDCVAILTVKVENDDVHEKSE